MDCVALRGVGISTWVRLDVGTGTGRNAGTCGRGDSSVSFFVATGSGVVASAGGATCAAAGGDARGGVGAASSSTTIRLGGGVGGVDPEVTVGVAVASLGSFFVATGSELAPGGGTAAAGGDARVGVGAASSSTTIRLGGVVGCVDPEVTAGVAVASLDSFFVATETEVATDGGGATAAGGGATAAGGGATCAAAGCITLGLAIADSDGIVAGVPAGGVAAGLMRTESGGTLGVGVAETARSSPGIRLDGGVGCVDPEVTVCVGILSLVSFFAKGEPDAATGDEGGVTCGATGCITLGLAIAESDGIVAGVVFSEAGCVDSGLDKAGLGATGGGVETFSWPFAGGGAAGLVTMESGGILGVGVAEAVRSSPGLRLDGGAVETSAGLRLPGLATIATGVGTGP